MKISQSPSQEVILLRILLVLMVISIALSVIILFVLYKVSSKESMVVSSVVTATNLGLDPQSNMSLTTLSPTVTSTSTFLPSVENQKPQLLPCTNQRQDVCYNSPGVANGKFQITLSIKDLNVEEIPYVLIDDEQLDCHAANFMPNVIVCSGSLISKGTWGISLYSFDGSLLSSGSIDINFVTPSTPTKKPSDDQPPSYP